VLGILCCQLESLNVCGKKDAKEKHLREALTAGGFHDIPHAVPLPSAPHVWVEGVDCNSVKMFKFALYPAVLSFIVDRAKGGRDASSGHLKSIKDAKSMHKVMIKTGDDDLRQDKLLIIVRYIQVLLRCSAFLTLLRYAASCHNYIFPGSVFSTAADVPEDDNDLLAANAAVNDAEEMGLEAASEERCLDDRGMRTVPGPTLSRPPPPHID